MYLSVHCTFSLKKRKKEKERLGLRGQSITFNRNDDMSASALLRGIVSATLEMIQLTDLSDADIERALTETQKWFGELRFHADEEKP